MLLITIMAQYQLAIALQATCANAVCFFKCETIAKNTFQNACKEVTGKFHESVMKLDKPQRGKYHPPFILVVEAMVQTGIKECADLAETDLTRRACTEYAGTLRS